MSTDHRDHGDETPDEAREAYLDDLAKLHEHQRAETAIAELRRQFRDQPDGPIFSEKLWRPSDVAKGKR